MFTGIIEEKGVIKSIKKNSDGFIIDIKGHSILQDLGTNDSVSCSGICLTVTKILKNTFSIQMVDETIKRTNAKFWKIGTFVNLERALLPTTRIGGHFVQGHVDCTVPIKKIYKKDKSAWIKFENNSSIDRYIIEKGSVALDGVSLTVASCSLSYFEVALIPHTMNLTTFGSLEPGHLVNLEVDMMSKYLENFVNNLK